MAKPARTQRPPPPKSAQIVDLHGRPIALYEGAKHTRRTRGWVAGPTGPNAEIGGSLATLRNRHRDLARNNPWARRAIQAVVTNTIGTGLRAQWKDPNAQAIWADWFETPACDADGRQDGYGLQSTLMRTIVEGGEVLARRRPRRADRGLPVPLQIQILEPDFIDLNKSAREARGQRRVIQGVEFDRTGQRTGYWLLSDHPGEQLSRRSAASRRYPAADMAHIFRADRPGQVHGTPWGTGAMTRLRMLDDYQDAQLERQRMAACYMAFVRDIEPGHDGTDAGELVDKFEPGAIEFLPPGKDIHFASPPQPEDDKDFLLAVLRAVAADYGIPYEILTGDLSEVNFSSARMGWNEFARNIDAWRWQMMVPQALQPIVDWFREAADLAGYPIAQQRPLWTAPARVMVDATREVPALIKAVRAGLLSMPEAIRQQGYDPDLLLSEQADWQAKLDAQGITLDTDPRADIGRDDGSDPEPDA